MREFLIMYRIVQLYTMLRQERSKKAYEQTKINEWRIVSDEKFIKRNCMSKEGND